jgi:hypothetical protein
MKECLWCYQEFAQTKRGQLYCSSECRVFANEDTALLRKESIRRQRRKASAKKCVVCGAKLSMYGIGNTCSVHINPKLLSATISQIKRKA